MNLFQIESLSFSYTWGSQQIQALSDLTFEISDQSLLCLVGPSGSGKSTLLNLLGLIEPIQKGTIQFNGRNFGKLSESERNELRKNEFGFVFQSFHLIPVLTIEENIEFFLLKKNLKASERKERIHQSLASMGLLPMRKKKPLELSGGQRQRVAIARALAKHPRVILADEPTASLDQNTGKEIMGLLQKLHNETGTTVLLSSHDPMVQSHCQKKLFLQDGKLQ